MSESNENFVVKEDIYPQLANSYLQISQKSAENLAHLCARVHFRLAEAFETGGGGLDQNPKEAQEQIRSAVRMIAGEKAVDRKYGIETQTIYEAFARITGIAMENKPFLTSLEFCEYLDFEDDQIASMQTMGGDSDLEIPVNVFAEPGSDDSLTEGTVCTVDQFHRKSSPYRASPLSRRKAGRLRLCALCHSENAGHAGIL